MTTNHMVAAVGHGSTAFWYLTRATGLVSLILLSGTVVLGMVASVGWTTARWPRFLSQAIHRNLSLLCLCLIVIHVVTTVADGYVPIGYVDAVVPFRTPYRPLWVGLGAVSLDLLLAVAVTSGLRRHIGAHAWRSVHWLAYLCWPVAVFHAFGSGSDTRLSVALVIEVSCIVTVGCTGIWRLVTGTARSSRWRLGAGGAGLAVVTAMALFVMIGPLQPGWSHRAGTSTSLLAQLGSGTPSTGSATQGSPAPGSSPGPTNSVAASAPPSAPFTESVTGSYTSTVATGSGHAQVTFTLEVGGPPGSPLLVRLDGTPEGAGIVMSSGSVSWGSWTGKVTSLSGSVIGASLGQGGHSLNLVMDLHLDRSDGSVSGSISGTSGGSS